MGVNQDSSTELGLCPKLDSTLLSSSSGQCHIALEKLLVIRTGLSNLESQRKITTDQNKVTCETTMIKIESQNNPSPLTYFTEHLTSVFEKPP
jgi:hypothetical protein